MILRKRKSQRAGVFAPSIERLLEISSKTSDSETGDLSQLWARGELHAECKAYDIPGKRKNCVMLLQLSSKALRFALIMQAAAYGL